MTTLAFGQSSFKTYKQFDQLEKDYLENLDPEITYVINFWATWCVPCVKEMPLFEKLNEDYKSQNIKVVLISLDFESQVESKLIPYLEKNDIQSEVVLLTDGNENEWIDKVDPKWSGAIPVTLIFKEGKKFFFEKAYESYEDLLRDLDLK